MWAEHDLWGSPDCVTEHDSHIILVPVPSFNQISPNEFPVIVHRLITSYETSYMVKF